MVDLQMYNTLLNKKTKGLIYIAFDGVIDLLIDKLIINV